jgi:spore coat polysaccharide biosynthesis protein SpsF
MSNANVGLVLQARLASTRLPGKALEMLGGVSILERCLRRLKQSRAGQVTLATTDAPEDDALEAIAHRLRVPVYRGSTDDVVGRYVGAAVTFGFDVLVRATGDNPAVDIDAPGRVLHALEQERAEYVCEDGLPYGAGVEAVRVPALARSAAQASSRAAREHVTLHIKERPDAFRIVRLRAPAELHRPDIRVTVDTPDDLASLRRIFSALDCDEPTLSQIIAAANAIARNAA